MESSNTWSFEHQTTDNQLVLAFAGDWQAQNNPPTLDKLTDVLKSNPDKSLSLNGDALTNYDSNFIANLLQLYRQANQNDVAIDLSKMPNDIQKLLGLALSTAPREIEHEEVDHSIPAQVGRFTLNVFHNFGDLVEMIGATLQSLMRLFRGQRKFVLRDLTLLMQSAGPDALGIVCLISFLIGVTLAFIGALQLQQFGAGIYVADLEMIGMSREMACLMTAIVMAGRTGAAYAAELGSMTSNEEIDALKTMAIEPIDYLILPRMLALILMMPLLVVYSNIVGNLGGILVATSMLHLSFIEYVTQAHAAFNMTNLFIGIFKGVIFGYLIALSGCLSGIKAKRSAQAVGMATTKAVVTSIVLIIGANAIIDFILNVLGI